MTETASTARSVRALSTTDVEVVGATTGPRFEHHQCIGVACTACGEQLGEDTIIHFDSMASAITEINRREWQVTDDAVRCYDCIQASAGDADAQINVVSRCRYCWPPQFSDEPRPQSCQCDNTAATVTHRLRVPFITHTHPAFTTHSCVTLTCGECGQNVSGNEEYDPHFSSPERALQRAAEDYDWLVSDALVCCERCAHKRACAAIGHRFPTNPNHVLPDGTEIRSCANCDATARRPIDQRNHPAKSPRSEATSRQSPVDNDTTPPSGDRVPGVTEDHNCRNDTRGGPP